MERNINFVNVAHIVVFLFHLMVSDVLVVKLFSEQNQEVKCQN